MTELKTQLNYYAADKIVEQVLEKAVKEFPQLAENCKVAWGDDIRQYKYETETTTHEDYSTNLGTFWHPKYKTITETKQVEKSYSTLLATCIHTSKEGTPMVLEITSKQIGDDNYDDVAIWIAGQLEKVFEKIIINVNNPEKLGQAIGWRCAYCNHTNTGKACEHCGAPRAW